MNTALEAPSGNNQSPQQSQVETRDQKTARIISDLQAAQRGTTEPTDNVEAGGHDLPPPDNTDKIALKAAQIAEQHQRRRAAQEQYRTEKAELARLRAENAELAAWKQGLGTDPLAKLTEMGITGDQITESILNAPSADEMRIRKLEARIEEMLAGQTKNSESTYQETKRQFLNETQRLVSNSDAFPFIKKSGQEQAVVNLIEDVFKRPEREGGGYLMTVNEAAKEVENYLRTEIQTLASLLPPKEAAAAMSIETQPPLNNARQNINREAPPTLSNRHTQSAPAAEKLTEKQRRERAILAFQGKL